MSFFFISSDIINGIFSFQPFILLMMLFCGFVLPDSADDLPKVFFTKVVANTLGLTAIVIINFNATVSSRLIVSSPFLNLDTFASIARSSIFLSFLLLLSPNKRRKLRFLPFVPMLLNLFYLILSKRVGSILLTVFCFFIFSYVFLLKKRKIITVIVLTLVVGAFALILLSFSTRIEVVNRIKVLFYQVLNLNHIYEGSSRERSCMIIRDFCMSLRFPFFGIGSNNTLKMNTVIGHNFFGCVSLSYGLGASVIYLIYSFSPIILVKKIQKGYLLYFALYVLTIELFDVFYGMGSLSRINYFLLGLSFFATRLPNSLYTKTAINNGLYYEVKL